MTESGWTDITIHHIDHGSVTVRVQAATPQDAAAILDPYVNPDTVLSGASTTRQAAVHAILQTRLVAARAEHERAVAAYDEAFSAVEQHAALSAADAANEEEPPAE